MAHQMAGWKSKINNCSTTESELWRNAGPSAFQFQEFMLKSDKIWCRYLVSNCVSLGTFWTPLVLLVLIRNIGHRTFGRYLSCTERTDQGKDFELILTVKMETRHPVEGQFGRELPAICNHCRVMTTWSLKTWKFCEQFLRFLEERSLSNCQYCADRAQYLPGPAFRIWFSLFLISSKSVHFRQSYCRTREDRFYPVEYFQYRLFEPINITTV